MEALVAVGLAGNVVQFVQFAGQLISLANEIKKKGAPSSLLELRKVAQGLAQQTRVIATRLKANAATLEQEEQHLLDVATDCEKAGEEFIAYIDNLIKTSKPSSRLESAKSSVKIKWRHNQIEAYIAGLDKLQGSLLLATMLSLRTRETNSHQEILEHLRSIEAGNNASHQSEDDLIKNLSLLQDLVHQQSGPKLDMLQKQMDSCMEDIQKIRSTFTDTREGEILRWLDFRQRTWRFEEVEEAHQTTFEWIFRKPHANTPWHDFGGYLSGADVSLPYFINGKAGSGKSTLMKYIISHRRTKAALRKWAGQHKLFSPHFFFWNVGTQLQKSHTGLLRSLLHSVLSKYEDLVPAVFPTLYTNGVRISEDDPPTYIELKSAFERMKIRSASFLRICIFIDGVDEFEGDHRDMATFLRSLASSTIKVVVSSRPINACLNVFKGCPTLRLQDLTHDDMRVFIEDRLNSHPMMAELEDELPEKANTLRAEIQERAEGVFLWVRLVTGLLLRGLEDGDDFDDLIPKLRALPTDLRELYTRMMQKMPADYQVQASQMFQIFEWWRLSGNDEPLELLLLSFAIQQPSIALSSGVPALSTQTKTRDFERIASRVRSRCCGLLEVRNIPTQSMFWPPTPVVAYLHRSVAEFVTDPEVWEHILSLTNDMKFNPGKQIACGILSILKTWDPLTVERDVLRKPRISDRTEYRERVLDLAMDVCRRITDMEDWFILRYMDALDKAMISTLFHRQDLSINTHWSVQMAPSCLGSDTQHLPNQVPLSAQANIRSFAAYKGVFSYLEALDRNSRLTDIELLIVFALGACLNERFPFPHRRETLWFLLQILGDRSELGVESLIGNATLWEHAVVVAYDICNFRHREGKNRANLMPHLTHSPSVGPPFYGPPSFATFDTGESWRSSVHHSWPCVDYDERSFPLTTSVPYVREEQLKWNIEELFPRETSENSSRNEQQRTESKAALRQKSERSLSESHKKYSLTSEREDDWLSELLESDEESECDSLFKSSKKSEDECPSDSGEKTSSEDDISNTQQAVDILRMFLSITDKPRDLLRTPIKTPNRSTFKPLVVLRKALAQGREKKEQWTSQSEYQFLYQLVGLPEAYQPPSEYMDSFEPAKVPQPESHAATQRHNTRFSPLPLWHYSLRTPDLRHVSRQ